MRLGAEEAWRTAARRLPFWVRLPDQSRTTRNRSSLPAVAAAMVMHATGRCESEGLDSPGRYKGGFPGLLGAQANDGRDLTQPVTLPAISLPSLRIVASDNKVPIGRDALPLEGRAVG